MTVGIRYEAMMRWVGHVSQLFAHTQVLVPTRRDPETGDARQCTIPDLVHITGTLERDEAAFNFIVSTQLGGIKEQRCVIHGTEGTIYASLMGEIGRAHV